MTYRTALYFAAGLAAFMSAGPVIAGPSMAPLLPSIQFVEENETATRARMPRVTVCKLVETKQGPALKGCHSVEKQDQKGQILRPKE